MHRFRIDVASGPASGDSFVSRGERVLVGSHPSCDLALSDPSVSRFHLELKVHDRQVIVRDLESRNGTTVDGVRIGEAHLHGPSVIRIGRSELRFSLDAEPNRIELSSRDRFGRLLGRSHAMRTLFPRLEAAARTDSTVLLEGETGVGKELAAEAIHEASARSAGPFVVIDCGALPHTLMDSELFGHEAGAFTGASTSREGAFEAAAGGTIFLDEIGELGIELQPKLLGALERREVRRIGGGVVPIDVRVIAATHRDLRTEVNAHRFRPDLYYRLAVLPVRIPALRERLDDVPLLVDAILADLGVAAGAAAQARTFALAQASTHAWPGNVRELRNAIERMLSGLVEPLPTTENGGAPQVDARLPLKTARDRVVAWFERRYLEQLLNAHEGNVSAAARTAGVDRVHLHRMLSRARLR
ncbi:MAG: sigma 54-dependent Fis family transcriptional regulator [Deltaproteobacteria bacterium]|nr:sigma 54-dependent Fis family transcriptional regulator [Deltaproteobacteria bacterium]